MRGRGLRPRPRKNTQQDTCTIKRSVFFTSFELGGGGAGKPNNPTKNTSFALGMRRACVLARMVQRTEAIA